MQARWTEAGWLTLINIAKNAIAYTGHTESGYEVIKESEKVWRLLNSTNSIWKETETVFGETRYWHTFHNGKVLYWKVDGKGPIFTGAFYTKQENLED